MNDIEEERGYAGGTYTAVYRPGRAPEGTVVIVPSIGDERRSLIRTEVELARRLAGKGLLAVRFDFSGDGSSPRRRSMEDFISDIAAAWGLTEGPVTAVTFRVGLYLLGRFLSQRNVDARTDIFAIGPISGGEFMREAERRTSVRSMMTKGAALGSNGGEMLDLAGDVYTRNLKEALSEPLRSEGLSGRILAVEIGPQKNARKDARQIVNAFISAGMKPVLPSEPLPDLLEGGADGIIIWKHPVIWGEVEHSDSRPLHRALFDFLAENGRESPPPSGKG